MSYFFFEKNGKGWRNSDRKITVKPKKIKKRANGRNGMVGLSLWLAITLVVVSSAHEFTAWMEAHKVERRCLELVHFAGMGMGFKVLYRLPYICIAECPILQTCFFSMNQPCSCNLAHY